MAMGMIGARTKLLYGFGTVAYGIKGNGFNFLLLIFYNQLLGLPAAARRPEGRNNPAGRGKLQSALHAALRGDQVRPRTLPSAMI